MASYPESMLWKVQQELVHQIDNFLKLETDLDLHSMLIFNCKADGPNQLGCGISTALRHALYDRPCNIQWRCTSNRVSADVLENMLRLQQVKTNWTLTKRSKVTLEYKPSEQSDVIYSRSAVPMSDRKLEALTSPPDILVYDDVSLDLLDLVLKDMCPHMLEDHKQQCIVALTVQAHALDTAKDIVYGQAKDLFDHIYDITRWYTNYAQEEGTKRSWKRSGALKRLYGGERLLSRELIGVDCQTLLE